MLLYHIPGNFANNRIKVRLKTDKANVHRRARREQWATITVLPLGVCKTWGRTQHDIEEEVCFLDTRTLLAVKLVEEELRERAQRPMERPNYKKKCGKKLENKGLGNRQLSGLMGTGCGGRGARGAVRIAVRSVKWPFYRGSLVCSPISGPVLGLRRTACALAVLVPFEIAAMLL